MAKRKIAVDLAAVRQSPNGSKLWTSLAWGDEVDVVKTTSTHVEVKIRALVEQPDGSFKPELVSGFIRPSGKSKIKPSEVVASPSSVKVLNVDFVDVQQGDAAVIESPKGRVVLVDGGDNQLFARYLASRYRNTTAAKPKEIDAIVVSHGDADHFAGLTRIHDSETHPLGFKRFFIHPKRVFHNGLVKRPGKKANGKRRKDVEMLGRTTDKDGRTFITGLETNILNIADKELNEPFRDWKTALSAWKKRGPIKFRRLSQGDDDAFDFLHDEGIEIEVLAPITTRVGNRDALPFLGNPKPGPRLGHESLSTDTSKFSGKSASHTINGHSVVMRLRFGNFTILFAGDLNDEAERALTHAHNGGELNLRSDAFKVPHHGSADFSAAFLQAVAPVVSIVSSGDESARKEFIHPRSTLVGALGKYARLAEPLVFITELVAFFQMEGWIEPEQHGAVHTTTRAKIVPKNRGRFFSFSRTAFGLVRLLTDGDRLLVYTNSGRSDLKEAYAFRVDADGTVVPDPVRSA